MSADIIDLESHRNTVEIIDDPLIVELIYFLSFYDAANDNRRVQCG